MKRKVKKLLCGVMVGLLVAAAVPAELPGSGYVTEVQAAARKAKPKLNKTKVTVKVGKNYKLTVNGTKKTPKWKSSNKKVATVSKTGKVTAQKAGKAKITATVGKYKMTCTVTVKKASSSSSRYAKNYTKVKNYINKHGRNSEDGTKYISMAIDSETTAILGYDKKTNMIDIGLAIYDQKENYASSVDVIANYSKSGTVTASAGIFTDGKEIYTTAKFSAAGYTGKKNITFRNLNGKVASKDLQKSSNAMLKAAMASANYILTTKLHMTVKDLGFTSYK